MTTKAARQAAHLHHMNAAHPHDYETLPESIKLVYSPLEYAWMGEERRRRLIADETTPEATED